MTNARPLLLTKEQAQDAVCKHLPEARQAILAAISEIPNSGYSHTSNAKTYSIDITSSPEFRDPPSSFFITISQPLPNSSEPQSDWRPNNLLLTHHILTLIRSNTDIPIPQLVLDTSLSLPSIPYHYLISHPIPIRSQDLISLSEAREKGLLDEKDNVFLNLQIGRFLGQMHSRVQNDWYGLIEKEEPRGPSYSWQETFTLFLETLLVEFETDSDNGIALPHEEIRRLLSRAIGFYLFDDLEVPSLVWFTGSLADIYITVPSSTTSATIVTILPNFPHALWGDPLLESVFMSYGVEGGKEKEALMEGYQAGGGGPILAFPRQRTKRIWYTLFMALVILKEVKNGDPRSTSGEQVGVDRQWAISTISSCVKLLRNAPCY
ncbi:hypothetical protein NLJ89_g8966 [Agrocybe chaxingu]|uniref:Aminoglycoside phosphotransferase domain-containing protein n=1 Tax=Agrocybe chaxingu TaxID=84603 RepID=A0A9W8MRN9_9AGAR|nr:hypothetical protein NLJ89_g8966 [Agrocybe chaxingu]